MISRASVVLRPEVSIQVISIVPDFLAWTLKVRYGFGDTPVNQSE